jgi:hypothetical protein
MIDLKERGRKGGLVGGRSKSKAKVQAARKNGSSIDAGRKRTRTLGEMLLRRKLDAKQHDVIREGFVQLTLKEQESFQKFFFGPKECWPKHYLELSTMDVKRGTAHPDTRMRHILRKFRLVARWQLSRLKE